MCLGPLGHSAGRDRDQMWPQDAGGGRAIKCNVAMTASLHVYRLGR
jgi:hypothetical protein